MRNLRQLDKWRITDQRVIDVYGTVGDDTCGAFAYSLNDSTGRFVAVASTNAGWDHVSVSLVDRCPTWDEMETSKRMFFKPQELAWQYHVPVVAHINCHPFTLHLWRKQGFFMPLPPAGFV